MCSLEQFKVDLKRLTDEVTTLEFDLDNRFFAALDSSELRQGTLHVSVSIRKTTGFFELQFHTEGTVTVTCDRCLDDMDQPISTDNRLVVKLGTAYSEEDDVMLAIPIKHVHAPGKCNPAMSKVLEELSTDRSSDEESNQPIDPRWSKLTELNIKD